MSALSSMIGAIRCVVTGSPGWKMFCCSRRRAGGSPRLSSWSRIAWVASWSRRGRRIRATRSLSAPPCWLHRGTCSANSCANGYQAGRHRYCASCHSGACFSAARMTPIATLRAPGFLRKPGAVFLSTTVDAVTSMPIPALACGRMVIGCCSLWSPRKVLRKIS